MVGHSYIPCTRENEARKSQVQDQTELQSSRPIWTIRPSLWKTEEKERARPVNTPTLET